MTDKNRSTPLSRSVSEIVLENMDDSAVALLLQQRRQVVIQCLEELLQKDATTAERNAAASAIGTLTELQRNLTSQKNR